MKLYKVSWKCNDCDDLHSQLVSKQQLNYFAPDLLFKYNVKSMLIETEEHTQWIDEQDIEDKTKQYLELQQKLGLLKLQPDINKG